MKLSDMLQSMTIVTGRDRKGNVISEPVEAKDIPALLKEGKGTMFLKRTVTRADAQAKVQELNALVQHGRVWDVQESRSGGLYIAANSYFDAIVVDGVEL